MLYVSMIILPWFQATYQTSLRFCPLAKLTSKLTSKHKFRPVFYHEHITQTPAMSYATVGLTADNDTDRRLDSYSAIVAAASAGAVF